MKYTRENLKLILGKINNCDKDSIEDYNLVMQLQLTCGRLFAMKIKSSEETEFLRKAMLDVIENKAFNFEL